MHRRIDNRGASSLYAVSLSWNSPGLASDAPRLIQPLYSGSPPLYLP
jgi:hypothetical protein